MSLQALLEQRDAKHRAFKPLRDKALKGEALNDGEVSQFDVFETEIRAIDSSIDRANRAAAIERHAEADPVSGSRDLADLERRFSIGKALGEFAENGRLTGVEAEYAAEHRSGRPNAFSAPVSMFLGESRAVLTTAPTAGPGGRLVPTNLGSMIDLNRPKLAVESMGATVLSGLIGNLDLPRQTGSGTAYWVPEHGEPVVSDVTFDKISLAPHTVAGLYEVSRRMLIQATQIETILRNDIGFILRQALDGAAIKGGGVNQPTGILATTGVQMLPGLSANGSTLRAYTAPAMIGMIEGQDAVGATGFLTNTKVKAAALSILDGDMRPLGLDAVFASEPVTFSNQVPSNLTKGTGTGLSALIYGVWSDLILAYWSNVDIVLNPYAGEVARKGGAYLHAFLDADVGIRHPANFVVAPDIGTASSN